MANTGIDLGTSSSAAAARRGPQPIIVPTAEGVSLGAEAASSHVACRRLIAAISRSPEGDPPCPL